VRERPAPIGAAGLIDTRTQAGVAAQLLRRGEALDVADLGGDRVAEHPGDAGHAHEQRHVAVLGAERSQLAVDPRDLAVELVDHRDGGQHPAVPGLGKVKAPEQLSPPATEQVTDRAAVPEGQQLGVDAVLERAALVHQEQPPASPLALGARLESR